MTKTVDSDRVIQILLEEFEKKCIEAYKYKQAFELEKAYSQRVSEELIYDDDRQNKE